MELRDVQSTAWKTAVAKGFNVEHDMDIPWEISLLHAEVSEAFEAWRKDPDEMGSELADVIIFAAKIGEFLGLDLDKAVERKLEKNAGRTYTKNEHGHLEKA